MSDIELKAVDCIEGMDALPAGSMNVCITSPPYNLGIQYRKYNDNQEHAKYLNWTSHWLSAVHRVLDQNGSLFLNLGGCPKKPLLPYEIVLLASKIFKLQNTFHWVKSISLGMKDNSTLSVGHFKPINSERFVNDCHEFIFHFTKNGNVPIDRLALGVPYMDKSNVKRWGHTKGNDLRCRGNVWFLPYKTIQRRSKQRPHPATFPPELAQYALKLHGHADQLSVIDPFVGIGNSALGARRVGVKKFVGFDIDESYIEDALRLLAASI
jgi:site-specific DNA-methyltransferase (adenine-specific)